MDQKVFFDKIRPLFGGSVTQSQVDGINRLLVEAGRIKLAEADYVAYGLATSFHETARRMQPVRETLASTDAGAVAALEKAWKAGRLSWVSKPYWRIDANGKAWFGRGDVQLTHFENYLKFRPLVLAIFGVDIVADPSAVLRPDISAFILFEGITKGISGRGDFTGHALETYLEGPKADFEGARRTVNGTDKAAVIAGYARTFLAALQAAGWKPGDLAPAVALKPPPSVPVEAPALGPSDGGRPIPVPEIKISDPPPANDAAERAMVTEIVSTPAAGTGAAVVVGVPAACAAIAASNGQFAGAAVLGLIALAVVGVVAIILITRARRRAKKG